MQLTQVISILTIHLLSAFPKFVCVCGNRGVPGSHNQLLETLEKLVHFSFDAIAALPKLHPNSESKKGQQVPRGAAHPLLTQLKAL